jgi:hypothetical protein
MSLSTISILSHEDTSQELGVRRWELSTISILSLEDTKASRSRLRVGPREGHGSQSVRETCAALP